MRSLLSFFAFLVVSFASAAARAEPPQSADAVCTPHCGPPVRTHMRSIPLFITGVVFDVAGGAATAGGIGLLATGASCQSDRNDRGCGAAGTLVSLAGVAAIVGGSALLAIGIPLTVVGATSVPDDKSARTTPRVRVGTSGLSVTF
jgi:hypothetical protein